MESLNDLKTSLLNFNFAMISIIHKILVLLENHLNYLKDTIFECFFKEHVRLSSFFSTTYNGAKFKPKLKFNKKT